jgi:hypothetical protein
VRDLVRKGLWKCMEARTGEFLRRENRGNHTVNNS